ncbi:MAG: hypothetical protein ABSF88_09110 [Candidatus Aminicenantales bacterium]
MAKEREQLSGQAREEREQDLEEMPSQRARERHLRRPRRRTVRQSDKTEDQVNPLRRDEREVFDTTAMALDQTKKLN